MVPVCVCAKSNCMLRPCKQSSEHLYVCTFEWQGFGTAVKALRPPKPEPVSEIPGAKPQSRATTASRQRSRVGLVFWSKRLDWRRALTIRPTGNANPTWGHPVQANRQTTPHRNLSNALVPTNRQANVASSPLRVDSCCRLGSLYQQEAQ